MDPFTQELGKIGVPTAASGACFAQNVDNLLVLSNVAGIHTGRHAHGNIEFWASNYGMENQAHVKNGKGNLYDIGDGGFSVGNIGYGSMQIHLFEHSQTVFAYNNFAAGTDSDFGVGNSNTEHPDWTFSHSLKNYKEATLYVYVEVE
jgi:sialate O-acetylesterase